MPDNQHPETFACPYCDRRYGFKPELVGKSVRCKCGEKFTVDTPQLEEINPYDIEVDDQTDDGPDWSQLMGSDDPPAPIKTPTGQKCPSCGSIVPESAAICIHCGTNVKSGKRVGQTSVTPNWAAAHDSTASAVRTKVTGAGLAIHGLGYLLLMLGVSLAAIAGMRASQGASSGDQILVMIGGFAVIGGLPLLVIGPFLGLAAPADAGRTLLIASIGFYVGGVVLMGLIEFGAVHQLFSIVQNIPFLLGAGCFLGFLQKLSLYLDDDSLYKQTEFLLKTFFLIVILTLLMFVPILGCLAVFAALAAQFVFALAYAWTVCQAALSAIKT